MDPGPFHKIPSLLGVLPFAYIFILLYDSMLKHLLSQLLFVFLFRMVFSQSLNEGDQTTKEVERTRLSVELAKAVIGYLTESLSILDLFFHSKRPKLVLIFSSNGTNPENAEMRSELQKSSFSRKDRYFFYIRDQHAL